MAVPTGGGLLERAICYTLGSVHEVAPAALARPTPCAGWDLRALLEHLNDSVKVLSEGVASGCVDVDPGMVDGGSPADPVTTFRDRAGRLLGAWSAAGVDDRVIRIGDHPLPAAIVAHTGAIEIAVHGWDIASACGVCRPIPAELAADILTVSRLVVTDATRYPLFAAPVRVSPLASPSDRLVAFLGRRPSW